MSQSTVHIGITMAAPPYAVQKLAEAVHELVTGAGGVQERLSKAAVCLRGVPSGEIPEDLRRVLVGLNDDLSFQPAQGEAERIAATMRVTGDEDARAIARRIFDLYLDLDRRLLR